MEHTERVKANLRFWTPAFRCEKFREQMAKSNMPEDIIRAIEASSVKRFFETKTRLLEMELRVAEIERTL